MSENFQNPSALGTANSWQVVLPVVSNAAFLAGSACNFSTVSSPTVNTAAILPSASGTSYQPLLGSAYPCQQINTGMLSGGSGQNQTFTSAASYPSIIQWNITGSAQMKSSTSGGFTLTVTDQDTAISSTSVVAQYHNTSHTTSTVPLSMYPSLTGRRVERTPPQGPHHSQSLLLSYQEGSQVPYYNQGNLTSLLSLELGHFLQSYDSMSYTGGRGSALQTYNSTPEMVMVVKEVQPSDNLPLASTSGFYNSVSAQSITQSRFQVMDSLGTRTSLGLQPTSHTFCQTQSPESPKSSRNEIELHESNPPPELDDSSLIAPVQSNLALSTQDPPENNNVDVIKAEDSDSLDSYPNLIGNKDPLLCPVESSDLHQFLSYFDPLDQEKQVPSANKGLGKSILHYEIEEAVECDTDPTSSLTDIATLEGIDCPSLFESLQDLDQPNSLQNIDTKLNITHKVHQNSSAMRHACGPPRKNKNKASKPIEDEPQNKIQRKNEDDQFGEEVRATNSMVVNSKRSLALCTHKSQQQKVTSNSRKAKSQGQLKTIRARENKTRKVDETRLIGPKGEAEGKTATAQTKHKRNPPEVRQEPLKKPRSSLSHHMPKGFQPSSVKPRPQGTPEEKGIERPQIQSKKTSCNAGENSSSIIYELPPPSKVKFIPLPFLPVERPRHVSRRPRPQTLAASAPAAPQPARPGSSTATKPTGGKSLQPIPSCLANSGRPAESFSTNAPQAAWLKPTRPTIHPSETSRPAPVRATFSSVQRDPRIKPVTKGQTPPKSENPFSLQDFSAQGIPWRESTVPEPVMSTPIMNEQRPEREALKRKAQREWELAAKNTSVGKLLSFPQRERHINNSLSYGSGGID